MGPLSSYGSRLSDRITDHFKHSFTFLLMPEWISSGLGPILAAALLVALLFTVLIILGLGEEQLGQSFQQTVGVMASPLGVAVILCFSYS